MPGYPCCCDECTTMCNTGDYCTCDQRYMTVDFGAGGWTDDVCSGCSGISGEYVVDYNHSQGVGERCPWYYEWTFADIGCTCDGGQVEGYIKVQYLDLTGSGDYGWRCTLLWEHYIWPGPATCYSTVMYESDDTTTTAQERCNYLFDEDSELTMSKVVGSESHNGVVGGPCQGTMPVDITLVFD